MTARHTLRPGLLATLLAAVFLTGCVVAQSYRVALAPGEVNKGNLGAGKCASEAGSYSLSMTTWKFEVARYGTGPYVIEKMTPAYYPDTRFTYCLDYLASVLADDTLSIGYSSQAEAAGGKPATNAGLLSYVASFAVDRSADIARDLIRAIFVVLSGDPKFGPNRFGLGDAVGTPRVKLGAFEVDPLDPEEMAALNSRLRAFGFCLVLGDFTYDTNAAGAAAYCNNPQAVARKHPSPKIAELRGQRWVKPAAARGGILYRPRLPYTLSVYTKDDPQGPGGWLLRMTKIVELENLSPIISLGLNRAAFAQSRVGLEFDNGVLGNFCISKTSELGGFIDIPLDIVYGIVSLPSATITAEIGRARQTKALLDAETQLIKAQRDFIEFEKNKGALPSTLAGSGIGSVISGTTGCDKSGGCKVAEDRATAFPTAVKSIDSTFVSGVCDQSKDSKAAKATPR